MRNKSDFLLCVVVERMMNEEMSEDNNTILLDAIDNNDIATISSLIENGIAMHSSTALRYAAEAGNLEIMRLLLDGGVDIDAVDECNESACHGAILGNHFDALQLLVERGASVGAADEPLLGAVSCRNDDRMALLLLDAGAPIDNLTHDDLMNLVNQSRSIAVLNRLLARQVDVSALRDNFGNTLCHRVIFGALHDEFDVEELVRTLVCVAGVDIEAVSHDNATALHYAALSCNTRALRLLIELGADLERDKSNAWTPLRLLAEVWENYNECVDLLLAFGANACLVNSQGLSMCHQAARHRNAVALCAFHVAGCELDQPNSVGDTARMIAIREGCQLPTAADMDVARRRIAKIRLDLVRQRATEVCIGLQPLNLDALQLCEIAMRACGVFGALIEFHQWWKIATTVKHFHNKM
jgi:ankyrin repeat protein